MKVRELRENLTILEWLANLNAATNTERAYLIGLQEYTEFTSLTPDELIEEAEEESRAGVLARHRKIKKHLILFRKHLQDAELADFSVRSRMTAVKSFYNAFEIEMSRLQSERRKARTLEENNTIPTKEDLQDILKVCDPLEKAVVLTGASSGLASNEVRNLRLYQFLNGYDPIIGVTTLEVVRKKTGVHFILF